MRDPFFKVVLPFLTFAALAGCTRQTVNLPDYGTVPEFRMTDSRRAAFDSAELKGKVWIADFIYTSCGGACPMMTERMRSLARELSASPVRFISISVDPAQDTPPVLDAFAHQYGAPTPKWTFLTGNPQTVHQVAYTTFHVGDVIGKVDHSTKFILVDGAGHIRGYYSSLGPDDLTALRRDALLLSTAG